MIPVCPQCFKFYILILVATCNLCHKTKNLKEEPVVMIWLVTLCCVIAFVGIEFDIESFDLIDMENKIHIA